MRLSAQLTIQTQEKKRAKKKERDTVVIHRYTLHFDVLSNHTIRNVLGGGSSSSLSVTRAVLFISGTSAWEWSLLYCLQFSHTPNCKLIIIVYFMKGSVR